MTENHIDSEGATNDPITGLEIIPQSVTILEKSEEKEQTILYKNLYKLLRKVVKDSVLETKKNLNKNSDSAPPVAASNVLTIWEEKTPESKKPREKTTLMGETKISLNIPHDIQLQVDLYKLIISEGRFTFAERLSDWIVETRRRANGQSDSYYRHIKSKILFRSYTEVVRFLVHEEAPKPKNVRTPKTPKSRKEGEGKRKGSDCEASSSNGNPKKKRQDLITTTIADPITGYYLLNSYSHESQTALTIPDNEEPRDNININPNCNTNTAIFDRFSSILEENYDEDGNNQDAIVQQMSFFQSAMINQENNNTLINRQDLVVSQAENPVNESHTPSPDFDLLNQETQPFMEFSQFFPNGIEEFSLELTDENRGKEKIVEQAHLSDKVDNKFVELSEIFPEESDELIEKMERELEERSKKKLC